MKNIIPIIAALIAIWVILLIPFNIIGYGFLPPDDAMRHSAKVISGKDWNQILVLRDEIKVDSYPGWHSILRVVNKITNWDQNGLVLFSVIFLFLLFCLIPALLLVFPESWLLSLLAISVISPDWLLRLFLGRPYLFTMASLLLVYFMQTRLKDKKYQPGNIAILSIIFAFSVWIHASWYFFPLLIISFMLAREWRSSALIAISSVLGISIGASLTGHPFIFLKQEAMHLFFVFGNHDAERLLVSELRSSFGDYRIISMVLFVLIWKALRRISIRRSVDSPFFILMAISFIGGLVTKRIWLDWGMAAFIIWITGEFEDFFKTHIDRFSWKRIILVAALSASIYISFTVDAGSRWSLTRPLDYISSEDPEQSGWLPGAGGIIYSDDMGVFYQTFYRNPKADWRYILGFESSFMPKEDLVILRNIQRDRWTYKHFDPWVKKMRPEDRLIIRGNENSMPNIPELEWKYAARGTWIGRKPRAGAKKAGF